MATSMILGKLTLTGNCVSYACKKQNKKKIVFKQALTACFK